MTLFWDGDKVKLKVKKGARRRVRKACLIVEAFCKKSMKKGGRTETGYSEMTKYMTRTGKMRRRRRETGTGKKLAKIGTYRSKEGEVPRVQTGTLRRSITHEMDTILPIGRVGTNLPYSAFLEKGTPKMKPRPFLRPALHKSIAAIMQLFRGK